MRTFENVRKVLLTSKSRIDRIAPQWTQTVAIAESSLFHHDLKDGVLKLDVKDELSSINIPQKCDLTVNSTQTSPMSITDKIEGDIKIRTLGNIGLNKTRSNFIDLNCAHLEVKTSLEAMSAEITAVSSSIAKLMAKSAIIDLKGKASINSAFCDVIKLTSAEFNGYNIDAQLDVHCVGDIQVSYTAFREGNQVLVSQSGNISISTPEYIANTLDYLNFPSFDADPKPEYSTEDFDEINKILYPCLKQREIKSAMQLSSGKINIDQMHHQPEKDKFQYNVVVRGKQIKIEQLSWTQRITNAYTALRL